MCLYPRLIENPKYKITKKNGGVVPPILDNRVKFVPIGCGNCYECRKQKYNEWKVRLLEDSRTNTNGRFVTLTFSNESIIELSKDIDSEGYERDNEIATLAVRRFLYTMFPLLGFCSLLFLLFLLLLQMYLCLPV